MRVGSSMNSSSSSARSQWAQVPLGEPYSSKPELRYCAGIISAGVATLKYFEISGWSLISRRSRSACWSIRATSS